MELSLEDRILEQLARLDERLAHIEQRMKGAENTLRTIDKLYYQARGAWWVLGLMVAGLMAGAWTLLHRVFPAPGP